jgi:hypothetical protein
MGLLGEIRKAGGQGCDCTGTQSGSCIITMHEDGQNMLPPVRSLLDARAFPVHAYPSCAPIAVTFCQTLTAQLRHSPAIDDATVASDRLVEN